MRDFTTGNVTRQILQFSGPLVMASVLQNLYSIIDSIIVGRFLGKEALAAVGASFPIIFTLISLVIGIGSGATTVVSQYFGAKNMVKVSQTIDTVFIFFVLASLMVSTLGIYFSEALFLLIGLPAEIIPDAMTYMNIYLAGMVLLFAVSGIGSVLRGIGDSRTPLVIVAVAALLNVLLDLLFVLVMKWGIAGVAYATVVSHGAALIGSIIYLNRNHPVVRFSIRSMRFSRSIFYDCTRIGLPTGLQQSFVSLGMLAVMGIVTTFGTDAVAAYSAALRIDSFAKMPSLAFSSALASFTGQNVGANMQQRIRAGLRSTLIISVLYSILVSVTVLLAGKWVMQLFTTDAEVIAIGHEYLVIVTSFYLFFSLLFTYTGLLRGAGATLVPMVISFIMLWVLRVPLSYFLAEKIGITGIWWALPMSWVVGFAATWGYYVTGKWRNKGVIKTN